MLSFRVLVVVSLLALSFTALASVPTQAQVASAPAPPDPATAATSAEAAWQKVEASLSSSDQALVYGATEPVDTDEGTLRQVVLFTDVYLIDRKYASMQGPYSVHEVTLLDPELAAPELLWLKSIESEVVTAEGGSMARQDFMCHVNVGYDLEWHNANFDQPSLTERIVTLSQGQFGTALPSGFGVPVLSSEVLEIDTMVLNHNLENPAARVRHKVTIRYILDSERKLGLKALFQTVADAEVAVTDDGVHTGAITYENPDGKPTCLPSSQPTGLVEDQFGRTFSSHWVVPSGRQRNETLVTARLNLPYDTTIHSIDVHLHPFAESLELKDLTTGQTVFTSKVLPARDGIGIAHVETYRSEAGLPVYRDHEYALVSVYDNPTDRPSDAMAVMYIHLLDKRFDRVRVEGRLAELRKKWRDRRQVSPGAHP